MGIAENQDYKIVRDLPPPIRTTTKMGKPVRRSCPPHPQRRASLRTIFTPTKQLLKARWASFYTNLAPRSAPNPRHTVLLLVLGLGLGRLRLPLPLLLLPLLRH